MVRQLMAVVMAVALGGVASAQPPSEFKGHTNFVYSVAFSPDGELLATGSFDNTIKIWEFKTGKEKHTLKGHTAAVYSVAFSPDGSQLASASQDKTIRVWNPKDGSLIKELKGHTDIVQAVAFSPDSNTLASGGVDKSVRLWNPKDGKELKNLGAHAGSVYAVAFSKDGGLLASTSNFEPPVGGKPAPNNATIKIWDVKGQKELKALGEIKVEPPKDKKDEKKDKDKEKKEDKDKAKDKEKDKGKDKEKGKDKDKEKDKVVEVTPESIPAGVTVAAFLDNDRLVTGGFDKLLHIWDVKSGKEVMKLGPTPDDIFGLAVSKDGKQAVTLGYGNHLRLWDLTTGKTMFSTALEGAKKKTVGYCVTLTPDGSAVVTGHGPVGTYEAGNVARVTALKK